MKLRLEYDMIYNFFKYPPISPNFHLDDEGNLRSSAEQPWQENSNPVSLGMRSSGGGANLRAPFLKALIDLKRKGGFYSGGIALVSSLGPNFYESSLWRERISPGLSDKYQRQFVSVLTGAYIVDVNTREALIAIDGTTEALTIFAGAEGAIPRKLTDRDSFIADMKSLEGVANSVLGLVFNQNPTNEITVVLGI